MTIHFFDTSALVKRYHPEAGSAQVQAIFTTADNVVVISELSTVETASSFVRRRNIGEVTQAQLDTAMNHFADDVSHEMLVARFKSEVVARAKDLVLQHGLRTLDALQLAAALSFHALSIVFVCADDRLLKVADILGLKVLNPLR